MPQRIKSPANPRISIVLRIRFESIEIPFRRCLIGVYAFENKKRTELLHLTKIVDTDLC